MTNDKHSLTSNEVELKKYDFDKWFCNKFCVESVDFKYYEELNDNTFGMSDLLELKEAMHVHYTAQLNTILNDLFHTSSHKVQDKIRLLAGGEYVRLDDVKETINKVHRYQPELDFALQNGAYRKFIIEDEFIEQINALPTYKAGEGFKDFYDICKQIDKDHWFDPLKERFACVACDCHCSEGDHDDDCFVNNIHKALEALEEVDGE